jgi:hypothetical protein
MQHGAIRFFEFLPYFEKIFIFVSQTWQKILSKGGGVRAEEQYAPFFRAIALCFPFACESSNG